MGLLFAATTGVASGVFVVHKGDQRTISQEGLTGSDYVDLRIKHNGTYITTGTANRLTVARPVATVGSEGDYQLYKPSSTAAASGAVSG